MAPDNIRTIARALLSDSYKHIHIFIWHVKKIIHVDSSQGESTLAFGVRNSSMDLQVRTREESGENRVTIKFP